MDETVAGRIGEELLEAGLSSIPNLLLDGMGLLGLEPVELVLLLQIWRHWWSREEAPSESVLAQRIGKSRRWVRELLRKLREEGLLARVEPEARPWAEIVERAVQEDVQQYCRQTYGREHNSTGYLLVIEQTSQRGQTVNYYDFHPLLAYLRALWRLKIYPVGRRLHRERNSTSAPYAADSIGGGSPVPPMGGTGNPPFLERAIEEREGKETTISPVVVPALALSTETWPTMAPALVALLDQIVRRLGERQANGPEDGRPALSGYESYKAVLAALSSPVTLAAVSREAPADLVEDLVVLACSLSCYGCPRVMEAIEVALVHAGTVPDFRLSQLWPHLPGAAQMERHMRQMLQEGGRLPNGGGFRHAHTLFVLLNRFTAGVGLLRDFLALCEKQGVKPVHVVLKRAVREGLPGITIAYLKGGVARDRAKQARHQHGHGQPILPDTETAERMKTRLLEYGVVDPPLEELLRADPVCVRAWMLHLDADPNLSPDFRCRILICRVRDGARPPSKFRRLAEALDGLTPEQEEWLEEHCPRPGIVYWSGDPESVGIEPDIADLWHEVYRH